MASFNSSLDETCSCFEDISEVESLDYVERQFSEWMQMELFIISGFK
jgi:hypothetical protein